MAVGGLIFAFEALIPKIEKFIEKVTGAAEAAKRAAEQIKAAHEQMAKFIAEPSEEEEGSAKAVKEAIKGKQKFIAQGVEESLKAEGYGGMDPEKLARLRTFLGPGKMLDDLEEENRQNIAKASAHRRTEIMKDLLAGKQGAISDVEGMAIRHEGLFPAGTEQHLRQTLPENIEAAKRQSQKAEADSEWADTTHAKREEARKENVAIQDEFDKALKDKHKYDVKAKATGFKDQLSELKSQLSDLSLDLKEKTITPGEYKEKADVLVDAIAAAIQGLAQVPGENAKTAHRDIEAAQRTVRSTFDRGVDAVKKATDKAIHDAKSAADKAKHEREKWDREHTPEAGEHRALAAERNEEMAMAQDVQAARADAGDRMAAQMGPAELQQVVAAVGRNRTMNSTLGFTLAQQVDYYMGQLEAKMVADFTRGMGYHDRSGQLINPRGGH